MHNNQVIVKQTDISDISQIDALYAYTVAILGSIDAVINNAGVFGPIGASEDVPWESIEKCVKINLMGTLYSMRKAVQIFKAQGRGGKILNLSGGGATKSRPKFIGYAITKTGIVRATETFADEVKGYGIDINAMSPGTLDTDMTDYIVRAGSAIIDNKVIDQVKKEKENGRESMDKAIRCAKFLLSSKSDGITGRLISAVWDDMDYIVANKEYIYEKGIYTLRRTTTQDVSVG